MSEYAETPPPQDIQAEDGVLGCLFRQPEYLVEVAARLPEEAFHSPNNRAIYRAMRRVADDGLTIEPYTVGKELGDRLSEITSERLVNLLDDGFTGANVLHYAEIVVEKWRLRELARLSLDVLDQAHNSRQPVNVLLDETERRIADLQSNGEAVEAVSVSELVTPVMGVISDQKNNKDGRGLRSGLYDLDEKLGGGFHDGEMIVLAARPSMGKTALGVNIAENISNTHPALIVSMEQSADELVERMLSAEARVNGKMLKQGNWSDEDIGKLVNASEVVGKRNLHIADVPGRSVSELVSVIRRAVHKLKAKIVVFDYLQLISSTERGQNRQEAVSEFSRRFKALARELRIPIIVLSQLNRELEKRNDKRPVLSDLRESGAIEQDADVVMLLHREEYYDKTKDVGKAEVIIAKQRNGPTGTVILTFQKDFTKFESYAPEMKSFHEYSQDNF